MIDLFSAGERRGEGLKTRKGRMKGRMKVCIGVHILGVADASALGMNRVVDREERWTEN